MSRNSAALVAGWPLWGLLVATATTISVTIACRQPAIVAEYRRNCVARRNCITSRNCVATTNCITSVVCADTHALGLSPVCPDSGTHYFAAEPPSLAAPLVDLLGEEVRPERAPRSAPRAGIVGRGVVRGVEDEVVNDEVLDLVRVVSSSFSPVMERREERTLAWAMRSSSSRPVCVKGSGPRR